MSKLVLEIKNNNLEEIENFLKESGSKIGIEGWEWMEHPSDLPWGKRKYYSSNRLASNGVWMDDNKYINPQLTRFECCMCLKVKPVSQLLVDYLGRCKDCQHK